MEIKFFGHILQILMTQIKKSVIPNFGHQIISFLATTLKIIV